MNEELIILELSHYLIKFKKVSERVYTFRCPLCGDSKKSKIKTRGYFYFFKNSYWFKCFNCDIALPLLKFIQQHYPELYRQNLISSFNQKLNTKSVTELSLPIKTHSSLLRPCSSSLEVLEFLSTRKIPKSFYQYIWVIDNVNELVAEVNLSGYNPLRQVYPRLVIPIQDQNNKLIGYVTRAVDSNDPIRYYNIRVNEGLFLWGQQTVDKRKEVYILEGILDSSFIPNSLATLSAASFQKALDFCDQNKITSRILVFDNEPRNKQIHELVKKYINKGERVVLYLDFPFSGKDINDLILNNSNLDIVKELKQRTYQGLTAQLNYQRWISSR